MKLQKLALGFLAGVAIYIFAFVIVEISYYHSTDDVLTIISRHWKAGIGIGLLATIAQYIIYNVLGVRDPGKK